MSETYYGHDLFKNGEGKHHHCPRRRLHSDSAHHTICFVIPRALKKGLLIRMTKMAGDIRWLAKILGSGITAQDYPRRHHRHKSPNHGICDSNREVSLEGKEKRGREKKKRKAGGGNKRGS